MSVESFHIDEVQDYLEGLCVQNKIVAHTKPVAGVTGSRRAFFRFESDEQIRAIPTSGSKNIVGVADFYGQRIGDPDDKEMRHTIEILFGVKKEFNSGDETEAINEASRKAEQLMFQFMNKMEVDFQNGCHSLERMEPEKSSWNKIPDQPWLDDYYGWILNLSFKSYMPEHDENDWEDPE